MLYTAKNTKQAVTDALKTVSKRAIQKPAEATGDSIGDKIADTVAKSYDGKIKKISRT